MIELNATHKAELESLCQEALAQHLTIELSPASDRSADLYYVSSPVSSALRYAVGVWYEPASKTYHGHCSCAIGEENELCIELALAAQEYKRRRDCPTEPEPEIKSWFCPCGWEVIESLTVCPDCRQPRPGPKAVQP